MKAEVQVERGVLTLRVRVDEERPRPAWGTQSSQGRKIHFRDWNYEDGAPYIITGVFVEDAFLVKEQVAGIGALVA